MADKAWDEVFARVRVSKDWRCIYPPRPGPAELDAVEQAVGFRLPASYRAFAERFGLGGEVAGWARLDPLLSGKADDFFTVVGRTSSWRKEFATHTDNAREVGEDFAAQLIAFGSTGGGDSYAFHPGEPTDPEGDECKVYQLARLGHWKELCGESFAEFLDNTARTVREWVLTDEPEEAAPPGVIDYSPDPLRRTLPFARNDVRGWLSANRGMADQLARAILGGRQWHLLPVLADALEDAGCADAHLLGACRSGNPQADGEWALGVLENMGLRK